jgi:hypothetical protein
MRPFNGCVRIDKRLAMHVTLSLSAACLMSSSKQRGLGGGRNTPSGSFGRPSLLPKIPTSESTRS